MMHTLRLLSLPRLSLLCVGLALALYCLTLAPTFGWGDSADLAMRMVDSSDATFVGTSRDYAFYRWVGGLFQHLPFGDAGTRANVMAAWFGAVSVGLVALLTSLVTRSHLAAFGAAAALTVSHSFWLMSVLAEVYSFNAALVLATFSLTTLWWQRGDARFLYGAALFAGLCLLHHASGLVLAATLAPLVLARLRTLGLWRLLAILLISATASSPYWLQAWAHFNAGLPLLTALKLHTPANPFFDVSPLREALKFAAYATYNFLGLGVLLALLGVQQVVRHRSWEMLPPTLWMSAFLYAGISSSIPDKFNIYVLVYPVLAVLVGVGIAALEPRHLLSSRRALALLVLLTLTPPLGYGAAVLASRALGIDLVGARTMPYRDNDRYFLWPGKRGDDGPRRYAQEALAALPKNAVLIADYSLWRPLYALQQLEQQRPDVTLTWAEPLTWNGSTIAGFIARQRCRTPVYLAADAPASYYQIDALKQRFTLTPEGVVVKVVRRCTTTITP